MRTITLLIFICLSLSVNFSDASPTEKILLTTQVWSPYQTYENNVLDGFAVQVVRCVLEKMEQPHEIRVYPWKRAQKMVKAGEAHGFFSASQNQIRDKYATISENIAEQNWNWYLLKESSLSPMNASFKKEARVAAMLGSNMLTWINKNGYNVTGTLKDTEVLIKTLLLKRHDAVLANELVVEKVMEKMKLSPERFHIYLNRIKPLGVYWSKNILSENPKFLERFNRFIKECR